MINTQQLKISYDLRRVVEQDLGLAPIHSGRAHLWKCPFHNEQKGYSLAVWADGYRCFGACATSGDALDWLTHYRRLSFAEALQALGDTSPTAVLPERKCLKFNAEPPEWAWQRRAEHIVSQAEETLWSEIGEPALNYLIGRGLTTRTIRMARLGYVPGDCRSWREIEVWHTEIPADQRWQ